MNIQVPTLGDSCVSCADQNDIRALFLSLYLYGNVIVFIFVLACCLLDSISHFNNFFPFCSIYFIFLQFHSVNKLFRFLSFFLSFLHLYTVIYNTIYSIVHRALVNFLHIFRFVFIYL